ncbi:MAG: thioesterase family protein [Ignavibacterium sp.]|jgi:acyl-CoA thioesterase FadM|nr:thioesterase family protein [Ignavibacterium sp.]
MQRIRIDLPGKFLFITDISVRVYDVNFAGHLSNDSILSMVHEARILFLKNWGYSEVDTEGAGIIMFDAAIQYKSQGYHGDILVFDVTVDNFIKTGCDFFFKITNKSNGKEIARVKTGIAFFDYNTNKLVQVPEKFKSLIESLKNN